MSDSIHRDNDRFAAIIANMLIIGIFAGAAVINQLDSDLYYLSVQEDEYLEWSSFWAFLSAGFIYLLIARRQVRARQLAWFSFCVALCCLIIAMEEISWGQRIIGYRPPQYFLAHNFQQELNVHNVVATQYRKIVLHTIIIGFGLLLPMTSLVPFAQRLLDRYGIRPSPPALIPAFVATWLFYAWYPWTHSGEWVELMLGLGLLFSGLWGLEAYSETPGLSVKVLAGWCLIVLLGAGSSAVSHGQRSGHGDNLAAADIELAALKIDFLSGKMRVRCDVHKRLYTYSRKYDQNHLLGGKFAKLTRAGLPEARASFLLDPWNSPYWIRDNCAVGDRKRAAFVYSFGPNRRRESTRWKITGDDVGVFILEPQPVDPW
jgi:hypothetical protein